MVADQEFRDLMAGVCAPVTVVTAMADDRPHGATVSAFASLSLRPPMVTVALDSNSQLLARIERTRRFGINVLSHAQGDLAPQFARRSADRFDGVEWHLDHGLPRLAEAPGWIVCDLAQNVPGGDHRLLLGSVAHARTTTAPPLVYGHRTFGTHSGFARRPRRPLTDQLLACSR
ncbi:MULTISPECIES: flavin reductase family protein [unclassified Streptomyces]|uniref:flavin reductase family protein n=1 Tax=unclassified Streptomyces TaxID=2593676 RepID=UPI00278C6DFB|nr:MULTISPECIES: flavin reductase family protein [unclassified Streptomyces]